jgi:hypothetical protein
MWEAGLVKYYKRLPEKILYKIVCCSLWKGKPIKEICHLSNQVIWKSKKLKE